VPRPFDFPRRPADRALLAAGRAERLARAAWRLLRSGALAAAWAERRRPRAGAPRRQPADRVAGAPVLYLPAVAWGYRFQRPQQLALALARAGRPVLYVDGFLRSRLLPERRLAGEAEEAGGVSVLQVRVPGRPDPYREALSPAAARRLAATIREGLRERPGFVLAQLPFWEPLARELAGALGVPLVYDRIDLHTGFPGVPPEVARAEGELMRAADLVCASAARLAEEPRRLGARVLALPNAVDLEAFPPPPRRPRPAGPENPDRPTAAYVGALGPWFDAGAVRAAAEARPAWRFQLAGRVEDAEVAALGRLANVELAGEIPFREVAPFLAGADVALVPFRDLPLTRAVDPVKLYEALALGLPVVARRLPETERWEEPNVYLYEGPEDFLRQVERAALEDDPERAAGRRRLAEGEGWDERAAALLAELEGRPPEL
jgi:glycosyltransferase involved in cell wall biosynthesis